MLRVDRLTKVYADGTHALDGFELHIPVGCFFGLLGPNGAGKTTLISSLPGLVRAPPGRIFVFGRDAITDLRARLLFGLAPQEVHLDRFLTARELLAYHGRYFGMSKTRGSSSGGRAARRLRPESEGADEAEPALGPHAAAPADGACPHSPPSPTHRG